MPKVSDFESSFNKALNAIFNNATPNNIHDIEATLPLFFEYYYAQLAKMNPASLSLLAPMETYEQIKQNGQNRAQLRRTLLVLLLQLRLDAKQKRHDRKQDLIAAMLQCSTYLELLTPAVKGRARRDAAASPVKYTGLRLAAWLTKKIDQIMNAPTITANQFLDAVNSDRLAWIGSRGIMDSTINLLATDFYNAAHAQDILHKQAIGAGDLSWIIYYAKLGLTFNLILQHTIRGPWMSDEEKQIPWPERFKTQLQQRKFNLLNDTAWGTVNLITFFWLVGSKSLANAGNLSIVGVILLDMVLAIWRVYEESTKHNREVHLLNLKIASLKEKSAQQYAQQIQELEDLRRKSDTIWLYKKYAFINDIVYSTGLLAGFGLMEGLIVPSSLVAPTTTIILGVAGGVLWSGFTLAYHAISGGLEIKKERRYIKENQLQIAELEKKFYKTDDENFKQYLFLEIKSLMVNNQYQEQVIQFQKWKLVQNILMDILVPTLIFASLVFLSTGVGIGAIVATFAVVAICNAIIDRYKPKLNNPPSFDLQEYKRYQQGQEQLKEASDEQKKPGEYSAAFFKSEATQAKNKARQESERAATVCADPETETQTQGDIIPGSAASDA